MKICSLTMAPSEEDAKQAIASVHWLVDQRLVRAFPEPITDFGEARNGLLAMAHEQGFDWAIMLDCDERIISAAPDVLRDMLDGADADVIMVPHVTGFYEKERIFRLPARGHYHGRTHEAFIMDGGAKRITTDILAFDEIAKTPEQYRAKVERDLPLLERMTQEDPKDPRWWYYLGDTHTGLGHTDEALAAFAQCWYLNGWDEESAWAAYRIAEVESGRSDYGAAIQWCTKGMQRHPGMAELPWLAGWCCFQLGQWQRAIWWAAMAEALNKADADGYRVGFRYPPALYEGPYDILRYCYRALGENSLADLAEACFQERYDERTSREKIARS